MQKYYETPLCRPVPLITGGNILDSSANWDDSINSLNTYYDNDNGID